MPHIFDLQVIRDDLIRDKIPFHLRIQEPDPVKILRQIHVADIGQLLLREIVFVIEIIRLIVVNDEIIFPEIFFEKFLRLPGQRSQIFVPESIPVGNGPGKQPENSAEKKKNSMRRKKPN